MVESLRWRRLRWRLRGAWQWPAFVALTAVDVLLLTRLPFSGEGGDAVGALLLAGFANLIAVAFLAPLLALAVRRRRPDLPVLIARDYAGAWLVAAITAALLAGGLSHRGAVRAERADQRAVYAAVHAYVLASAPRFAGGLGEVDALELEPEHYRACVPGPDPLPLCLFVNTDQTPAGVQRDPAREPNSQLRR
ncbi:MAG TPA: hypothetical protein VNS09_27560 [Solirubrobacter sp.]|nr:hypothetical protein [Solirubrobacter sp.]